MKERRNKNEEVEREKDVQERKTEKGRTGERKKEQKWCYRFLKIKFE